MPMYSFGSQNSPSTSLIWDSRCSWVTHTSPSGWAGQWYPFPFTLPITISEETETFTFPTAEHWIMFQKALLFNDIPSAWQVLLTSSLAAVKALGRQVSNFEDDIWNRERSRIVLEGNLHKFEQNPELKEMLLGTGEKVLVEASPRDRIWGIGYGEKNAMNKEDQWGLNLLGQALMETRR
ncbi:hypothetical protein DFS33DRAFT_1336240 [Desarmillaria ectypa]|nr:hypothetical protein DFS33DRAFT_1336240 [Desarmillaria ectypa]